MVAFDLLIRGGLVVDGSGARPATPADVGISGDRIAAIGALDGATAARTIDATGQVVSPGFIDVHAHSEIALLGGPHRYGALAQGVTTQLLGPDGFGWAQLPPARARELWEYTKFAYGGRDLTFDWPTPQDYLDLFAGNTPANVLPQVPHCAVRLAVVGWEPRRATAAEIAAMASLTRAWYEAGATCLNLGLDYQPSANADFRELAALCRVAREYDAIYAAHLRYTDYGREGAWREIIRLGEETGIPVHVSHESVDPLSAALLDEARDRCDLTFESYLYPAGCTHLALMLPIPEQGGGPGGLRERLRDPRERAAMAAQLDATLAASSAAGARAVFVANQTGRYIGQSLDEAAAACGESRGDFAVRVLAEEDPYALMVFHRPGTIAEQEAIQRATIAHPQMLVASDGVYHGPSGHPRGYGCFARILRLAVREWGAVSLEGAIHKMSGLPAARFRLADRGLLREGYGADVVIFDPATVADEATWDAPFRAASGIAQVIVNGEVVIEGDNPTGVLPGRVLGRR
jgi:N-acyl-D-amino-acid deacylase